MKLLVTADVHLSADRPERLRALERVVGVGAEEGVDALLIAGDLFDADVDVEAVKPAVRDVFSGNAFPTYAIPGNHDRTAYREEDYFGDDFAVLRERPVSRIDLGAGNLVAVPFVEDGFADLVPALRAARVEGATNVLVLHGTLSTSPGGAFGGEARYLPFTPEQLVEAGFEYVFAGHIHASPTKRVFGDGECVFAYPGSPASVTTGETGRRGVWLLEDGALREVPLDTFHYVAERLDLSPGTAEDALDALDARLAARDLAHATLLVEPTGFVGMDEAAFYRSLEAVVESAGAAAYEIDRTGVESAASIVESDLYRQFEETLAGREGVDEEAVRRLALRGLSREARAR